MFLFFVQINDGDDGDVSTQYRAVDWYLQIVYRLPGDEEKLTLYIQAVHADQQVSWVTEIKKGLHVLLNFLLLFWSDDVMVR